MCLRGKPGWGENMAYVTTLVDADGGQWFNMAWKPTIDTPAWKTAITYYADILKADGPPGTSPTASTRRWRCSRRGIAACGSTPPSRPGLLYDQKQSQVADKVAFATNPTGSYAEGPELAVGRDLAIPASTKNEDAAQKFITWATSKEYVELVAKQNGWVVGTDRHTQDDL